METPLEPAVLLHLLVPVAIPEKRTNIPSVNHLNWLSRLRAATLHKHGGHSRNKSLANILYPSTNYEILDLRTDRFVLRTLTVAPSEPCSYTYLLVLLASYARNRTATAYCSTFANDTEQRGRPSAQGVGGQSRTAITQARGLLNSDCITLRAPRTTYSICRAGDSDYEARTEVLVLVALARVVATTGFGISPVGGWGRHGTTRPSAHAILAVKTARITTVDAYSQPSVILWEALDYSLASFTRADLAKKNLPDSRRDCWHREHPTHPS
eukprot:scaffold350276_cov36-Prasinocladus_malaysianus.AAC.1